MFEENQLNITFNSLNIDHNINNQNTSVNNHNSYPFIVIDDITKALNVLEMLNQQSEVTFDCEGVNLGRTGKLTVITISTLADDSIAYVFDIETLLYRNNWSMLFLTNSNKSLKTLLESNKTMKITFDCRGDSDALWHQLNIKLANCIDLQVYNQGIDVYYKRYKEFVPGLKKVCERYINHDILSGLIINPPHLNDNNIWEKRPLSQQDWKYAANDIHLIKLLYLVMIKINLPQNMLTRIKIGSDKYLNKFRNHYEDVNANFQRYKYFILEADHI